MYSPEREPIKTESQNQDLTPEATLTIAPAAATQEDSLSAEKPKPKRKRRQPGDPLKC